MTAPDKLPAPLQGHVLVAGAGVSGVGCARMLTALNVPITLADDNDTARLRAAEALEISHCSVSEAQARLADFSAVVVSPGWRPDTPLLTHAEAEGIPVLGDVELAWRLDQSGVFGAAHQWVVITGTNGKTTTTAMTAAMLQAGGLAAVAVGNIGVAVGEALISPQRSDILVAELSSFQLHWSTTLQPTVGVLLNIADDHIDWHGSFEEYAAAKAKALRARTAVFGADDPAACAQVERLRSEGALDQATVVGFTLNAPTAGQLGIEGAQIVDKAFSAAQPLASAEGISPAGPAGQLDALAAAAVARSFGVSAQDIAAALQTFEVSGHRGQVVHTAAGVSFVDNSKATNPHAAEAALAGLENVIWVAGGQLKGADVEPLVRSHAGRMKAAVLLGVDRQVLAEALRREREDLPIVVVDLTDPQAAMRAALGHVKEHAAAGDTVLLAPAAASLDMFSGMGQRGDYFAAAARELFPDA